MSVTTTRTSTPAVGSEQVEVLIEEARRRGRRHRLVVGVLAATSVAAIWLALSLFAGLPPFGRSGPASSNGPVSAVGPAGASQGSQRKATLTVFVDACPTVAQPFNPTGVVYVWRGSTLVARRDFASAAHLAFNLPAGSYRLTSSESAPSSSVQLESSSMSRVELLANCAQLGELASAATPLVSSRGRLASIVLIGGGIRLVPPPERVVPSVSRAEALMSGRGAEGLGGFGPALHGGVPPIV